jgi:hypothetical protein
MQQEPTGRRPRHKSGHVAAAIANRTNIWQFNSRRKKKAAHEERHQVEGGNAHEGGDGLGGGRASPRLYAPFHRPRQAEFRIKTTEQHLLR